MKIGIDIDGVLTDEHTFIIDNATKFFSENNIPYEVNKDIYDNARIFNVTEDEYILFWKQYFLNYIKNVTIRPYASEIIKKLKEDNHEIFIITARPFTSYDNEYKEQMQSIAKEWLNKNGVLYDHIIFSENKVNICKEFKIGVMIEDKPENILSCSTEIPVICYDHPFNETIVKDNIYRCYSWYDIYEKIKEINSKQVQD